MEGNQIRKMEEGRITPTRPRYQNGAMLAEGLVGFLEGHVSIKRKDRQGAGVLHGARNALSCNFWEKAKISCSKGSHQENRCSPTLTFLGETRKVDIFHFPHLRHEALRGKIHLKKEDNISAAVQDTKCTKPPSSSCYWYIQPCLLLQDNNRCKTSASNQEDCENAKYNMRTHIIISK